MRDATLYAYSLVPVLSVAVLLFLTAVRRGRSAFGLAAFSLAVAAWSFSLFAIWIPSLSHFGERFAAVGAFITAGYLHAAYSVTGQRSYRLVWFAYGTAAVITIAGALRPGLLYGPRAMARGPLFWPSMALAVVAAVVPLLHLYWHYRRAAPESRGPLRWLFVAGVLTYVGGLSNALSLAHGTAQPISMFLVLGGLLVLGHVLREHESPSDRRLLERSLLYSAVTAFLSAGFLFGVLSLIGGPDDTHFEYQFGAVFLLCMAALAFEPLRLQITEVVGSKMIKNRAPATAVAEALAISEDRAEHAERLAEIGALASAVAHEVRNPLGILGAHLSLLARNDVDDETIVAMREQIERASTFVDDLLTYGRPRPVELRLIDVVATVQLALSTARQGCGFDVEDVNAAVVDPPRELLAEADQAQIEQAFVVLFDNALLAIHQHDGKKQIRAKCQPTKDGVVITIEDSGPGIPDAVADRLFEPFVTSRKREGPRPGTGLGLAIAKGIITRHHGTIRTINGELGGACFEVRLPKVQPVLASMLDGEGQPSPT